MNTSKTITDFDEMLDTCLIRMQSGEGLEQCLADFPDLAGELRPLLQSAAVVRTAPRPTARPQAAGQGQAAMLAALAEQKTGVVGGTAVSFGALRRYAERILSVLKTEETSNMKPALRSIFTTVFVVFISGFFALAISANSLPGEPFYPLKLGWESARLSLTFDADTRQQLESQIQQNRQGELEALIELGRQTQIVYEGIVEETGEEQMVVDGFIFKLNNETLMLVEPAVGEPVRIETEIGADGRLTALEISAGSLPERPQPIVTATPTPCNNPACAPPTATPTPCNAGACGDPSPSPTPTSNSKTPTPTPCNTPACGSPTPTPTVCTAGACNPSPTPPATSTTNAPTPTPCNTPACAPPTPTICNAGACGSPTPPPPPTSTPNVPTPTPCNTPACGPTPTPCNAGACGEPTPPPTSTPNVPPPPPATPTPCNAPACSTPQPTPTCNAGVCGGSPTPPPTNTPNNPTPTPCNSPACGTPNATPTVCNGGACGGITATPNIDD